MKIEKEETISSEVVYQGRIISVKNDIAKTASGQIVNREVIEHPGGVGVALEDDEGKFFMVEQYRYAQKKVMLEFPAGKKEAGEDPLVTAKRETQEETGYEGENFELLGTLTPTPAYDTEVIELYYAKQGKYVGQHLDQDEELNVKKMHLKDIIKAIKDGEIQDAKTIAMALFIKERKEAKNEKETCCD